MPTRYRADHIGSLLRPAELLQARGKAAKTLEQAVSAHAGVWYCLSYVATHRPVQLRA